MVREGLLWLMFWVGLAAWLLMALCLHEAAKSSHLTIVLDSGKILSKDVLDLAARTEWPSLTLLAGLAFRKQIKALFEGQVLEAFEGAGFKFNLRRRFEKIEALIGEAQDVQPVTPQLTPPTPPSVLTPSANPSATPSFKDSVKTPPPDPAQQEPDTATVGAPTERPVMTPYDEVMQRNIWEQAKIIERHLRGRYQTPSERLSISSAALGLSASTNEVLVLEAWSVLESDLRRLSIEVKGVSSLDLNGLPLAADQKAALDELMAIRDQIAHKRVSLSTEAAARFVSFAVRLHEILQEQTR